MDFSLFVAGLVLGVALATWCVALGLYLGERRVAQRCRLAAAWRAAPAAPPSPSGPPEVCGGADDPDETLEDRLQRDPDAWKG